VTIFLAALYLVAGISKLAGVPTWVERFQAWGYTDMFRVLVALAEIAGAIVLLIPRVASIGAVGLALVMLGAIFTHLFHGSAVVAILPLVLVMLLAYVGRERLPRPDNKPHWQPHPRSYR
jgi:uncharacterized membrane protein YphA (DoxX/SURF4 family)